MRSMLEARVASAERRLDTVEDEGDEAEVARVRGELGARREALASFERENTSRNHGMIGGGATLMGIGGVGLVVAVLGAVMQGLNGLGGPDPGKGEREVLALASGAVLAGGVALFAVGMQKRWKGPPSERPSDTRLSVGPGRLVLSGNF